MRKLLCLFSIAIFLHGQLFAQTVWDIFASSFSVAQQRFEAKDFHTAIELFKKDYKKRPTDITAVLIARSYYKIGEPKPTVFWYDKVQDVNNLSQNDWLQKAICFSKTGDYDKAANIYHRLDSQFPGKFSDAIHSMENIEHLYLDSLFYLVKPTNINTRFSEMSPAFYEGGIVFSSSRPGKFGKLPGAGNTELFDLYFAPFSKSGKPNEKNDFEVPVMFSQGLSSPANESNATFYKDETKMIFSSNVNDTEGGQGRLKLFLQKRCSRIGATSVFWISMSKEPL
ncbi:MAG: tetratricopeptide repeat protein [Cyclobacteriaceae bacterium]|nr:tetratricopeptide repeat protein [Cyclobacteriaceae bacterium]